jgi:hypothetical protein
VEVDDHHYEFQKPFKELRCNLSRKRAFVIYYDKLRYYQNEIMHDQKKII